MHLTKTWHGCLHVHAGLTTYTLHVWLHTSAIFAKNKMHVYATTLRILYEIARSVLYKRHHALLL